MTAALPFREFDPEGEVWVYDHGVLPHWRQSNCTYFVTFRQDDAIPVAVANEIQTQRRLWLDRHSIDSDLPNWKKKLAALPDAEIRTYERLIGKMVNEKLDQGIGSCVLKQPEIATIVVDALKFFHETRVLTGDFILMPNHVHVLMRPLSGFELEDVLFSIKSFTANKINRLIGKEGRFWQRESYDHIVRDADQLEAFQHYTRLNPVKAGLSEGDFVYQATTYRLEE